MCLINATSVNIMFKNKIDNYFKSSVSCLDVSYEYLTGHSISHWLPCPVPSWVPNLIGT